MIWTETVPDPERYVALRTAAGLGPRSLDAARRGLARTLHAACGFDGSDLIAMGRVVGDGGCFVMLVDIAVRPDMQGRGLGRQVTHRLIAWCETNLPPDCHISLVSSARAVSLYEAAGFRPSRGLDRLAEPNRLPPP